jgi:N-acylneuraminate cytidylyltransferase
MNIAVIPARIGSKRIPKKNIKLFNGLPMIAYAIQVAKDTKLFDEVVVSTDDDETKEIAISFGAVVPWKRSTSLSDDYTTTSNVMADAAKRLASDFVGLQNLCCVYATVPLLDAMYIHNGLMELKSKNWNYVFSAMRAQRQPERFFSLTEDKKVKMHYSEHQTIRSQDLPVSFFDAGQFYWGTLTAWEQERPIFSIDSTVIELSSYSTVDIDSIEDWKFAEKLFAIKKEGL